MDRDGSAGGGDEWIGMVRPRRRARAEGGGETWVEGGRVGGGGGE
jgi:hypothetical protein